MVKIFITRKLPPQGLEILSRSNQLEVDVWETENAMSREELLSRVKGAHGILCTVSDKIDQELLDAAGPQLKVISTMTVGTAHIDTAACKKHNVSVVDTGDVCSDSAAEFTVALVLLVARRLQEGMDAVVSGEWGLWKPMWICGFEMGGRTLGVYGFGRVGFGVARRLKPFNIKRIIYTDIANSMFANHVGAESVDLDTLMKESDILCICCAATPQTIKSINKDRLSKMKEGSIIINTARGSIIDQDALDAALKSGRPLAAGLDVTEPEPLPLSHPLMKNPKCIITPHLGTATYDTRFNMCKQACTNLFVELLGKKPPEDGGSGLPAAAGAAGASKVAGAAPSAAPGKKSPTPGCCGMSK